MIAAALAAVLAVALLVGPPRSARRRLAASLPQVAAIAQPADQIRSPVRIGLAAVALVGSVVIVGGAAGLMTGLAAAVAVAVVPARHRPVRVAVDDVPVVIDLVAGCLDAGTGLPDALDAASVAADGLLGEMCRGVAAALRAGVPPDEAWQHWFAEPSLAAVARTAVRTAQSGAAAAEDLRRTSNRLRARRQSAAQHRVQAAAVWLVIPLGLCFLPAFVLVAVVPLVVGLVPTLR